MKRETHLRLPHSKELDGGCFYYVSVSIIVILIIIIVVTGGRDGSAA